jgi:hypothetical protein
MPAPFRGAEKGVRKGVKEPFLLFLFVFLFQPERLARNSPGYRPGSCTPHLILFFFSVQP